MDENSNSKIIMQERKMIEINGVKKIISFDTIEFLIDTTLGYLNVKGENLLLTKYDEQKHIVGIVGKITGILYVDGKKHEVKENLFSKLMK